MSRYKLVTFDVTNTLLKFTIPPVLQYVRAAEQYGVDVDAKHLGNSFKKQWASLTQEHPHFGSTTGLTSNQWWTEFVKRTFVGAGCRGKNQELDEIAQHLIKLFSHIECWQLVTGSTELLKNLKQRNVITGVISNFDERLLGILKEAGMMELFDFVICSYLVKCSKPDVNIFNLALQRCKESVTCKQAVHVGDSVNRDYHGAKSAGWNALLVRSMGESDKLKEVPSEHIVESVSHLQDKLLL